MTGWQAISQLWASHDATHDTDPAYAEWPKHGPGARQGGLDREAAFPGSGGGLFEMVRPVLPSLSPVAQRHGGPFWMVWVQAPVKAQLRYVRQCES